MCGFVCVSVCVCVCVYALVWVGGYEYMCLRVHVCLVACTPPLQFKYIHIMIHFRIAFIAIIPFDSF